MTTMIKAETITMDPICDSEWDLLFDTFADPATKRLTENEVLSLSADICADSSTMSGVYFLLSGSCVVYVGQSLNIFERISQHRKTVDFDSFRQISMQKTGADENNPRPRLLDSAESIYIHTLRPSLNKKTKRGDMRAPISHDVFMQWVLNQRYLKAAGFVT